jgi:hypothetical protein
MTTPTYPVTVEASLRILEATPATMRALLVSVPLALVERAGDEGWSAKDVLAHLAVQDAIASERFERIASEEMPTIANVEEQAALDASGLRRWGVVELLGEFERRRRLAVIQLRQQSLDALRRKGMHEVAGEISALDLLHQRAWHDLVHIRQTAALLAEPLDAERGNLRVF